MVATARVTMASSYHFHQLAVFQISNSPSLPQFLETGCKAYIVIRNLLTTINKIAAPWAPN